MTNSVEKKSITAVSFESRMAAEMGKLIEKRSWNVLSAPSMQEIPLKDNPAVFDFGDKLFARSVDIVICMTGVGMKMLVEILSTTYPESDIVLALSRLTIVARGPKPVKVLKELGVPIAITVPEPNTWFEILEELDMNRKSLSLEGKTVAVQEYGASNEELIEGLKKRGARVVLVPVYRWALPDDLKPLQHAIREICAGHVQVAFFTTATQIRHVLQVASQMGVEESFREGLTKAVIASVGPVCSEAIQECGFSVDFEPSHPKLGQLVLETTAKIDELLEIKKNTPAVTAILSRGYENTKDAIRLRRDSVFLKACRREKTEITPVWLMRQAGRYMKEYRKIRDKVPFIELCRNPELSCQVTVEACEKIKADAAIIFSDILLIVEPLGLSLEYAKGDGPVISGTVAKKEDVDRLREVEPESLSYVYDAIRLTRSCLNPMTPLLGFCGAPFTLASYMIEGGGSKTFLKTKQFMLSDKGAWDALMQKITRGLVKYLRAQIEAGADAVQIFDSWVGCLGPEDYRKYVQPHSEALMDSLPKDVPVIHFGTNTSSFLKDIRDAGGDVIGVDWRISMDEAWKAIGYDRAVQGNLDPAVLFAPLDEIKSRVKQILQQTSGRPGHIFNLGHGILPATPVDHVIALVEMVHELSQKTH